MTLQTGTTGKFFGVTGRLVEQGGSVERETYFRTVSKRELIKAIEAALKPVNGRIPRVEVENVRS